MEYRESGHVHPLSRASPPQSFQFPLWAHMNLELPYHLPKSIGRSQTHTRQTHDQTQHTTTMICTRCLTRLSRRAPTSTLASRSLTTTPSRQYSTPTTSETSTTTAPRSSSGAPSATSKPGVAQPFSTPLTPAPAAILSKPSSGKASAPRVQSSVPAGTVLKGLNFYKDKQDPVAMADEEYPAWLWGVLDKGKGGAEAKGAGVDEGDLYGEFLRLAEFP
jgi:hypothetical protein